MEFKLVPVSDSVSVAVPKGLSAKEEATFIAGRLAFVNFEELEREYREALTLSDQGKLIPLREVLAELEADLAAENGKST